MGLGDLLGDGKAEAGAAGFAVPGPLDPVERTEHRCALRLRDTRTVVLDDDPAQPAGALHRDGNRGVSELDGVPDQVGDDPPQGDRIPGDDGILLVIVRDLDVGILNGMFGYLDRNEVAEVHRRPAHLHRSAPGEAERRVDQRGHGVEIFDQPVPALRIRHPLGPQPKSGQVGLEVVRDRADQQRAFAQKADDAVLHVPDCLRKPADLRSALGRRHRLVCTPIEAGDGLGEAAQRGELVAGTNEDEGGDDGAEDRHPQAQRLAEQPRHDRAVLLDGRDNEDPAIRQPIGRRRKLADGTVLIPLVHVPGVDARMQHGRVGVGPQRPFRGTGHPP